jgi:hypothetical protein
MDREGVGGFLESILAVMVVITASSVFLVVLASGTMQVEENMDQEELISWLEDNGLYSEDESIQVQGTMALSLDALPDGIAGMTVLYRLSGNSTPLLVLEKGASPQGDVLAFQQPLLLEVEGRDVSGVMEVRAWR